MKTFWLNGRVGVTCHQLYGDTPTPSQSPQPGMMTSLDDDTFPDGAQETTDVAPSRSTYTPVPFEHIVNSSTSLVSKNSSMIVAVSPFRYERTGSEEGIESPEDYQAAGTGSPVVVENNDCATKVCSLM